MVLQGGNGSSAPWRRGCGLTARLALRCRCSWNPEQGSRGLLDPCFCGERGPGVRFQRLSSGSERRSRGAPGTICLRARMSGHGSRKALRGRQIIMRIREGLSCGAARLVSCYWVSLFIRGRSAYADPVRQPRVRRRVHIRRFETTFSAVSTSACSTALSQSRASGGEPTSFARVRASVMRGVIRPQFPRPDLGSSIPRSFWLARCNQA